MPGRRTRGSVGSRSKGATQLFGDLYPDTLHRVSPYGWGIGWSDAGRFIFIEAIANERHQPHAMVASVHFISAFGCEWCSAGLSLCCRAAWSVRECGRVPPPIGVRRSEYADQSTRRAHQARGGAVRSPRHTPCHTWTLRHKTGTTERLAAGCQLGTRGPRSPWMRAR